VPVTSDVPARRRHVPATSDVAARIRHLPVTSHKLARSRVPVTSLPATPYMPAISPASPSDRAAGDREEAQ